MKLNKWEYNYTKVYYLRLSSDLILLNCRCSDIMLYNCSFYQNTHCKKTFVVMYWNKMELYSTPWRMLLHSLVFDKKLHYIIIFLFLNPIWNFETTPQCEFPSQCAVLIHDNFYSSIIYSIIRLDFIISIFIN